MENERNHECRKCGGTGTPSKALVNYHFIDKSYLRGEKEFVDKLVDCIKCQSCGHSWIPVNTSIFGNSNGEIIKFPIESKSTREQALAWWNNLPFNSNNTDKGKMNYTIKYYGVERRYTDLTGREIEMIWKKETVSKWFADKSYLEQHKLSDKYFKSRNPSLLTIEQVEEIWLKETQNVPEIPIHLKPNQKQFKQFDESLFRAYINKFSEEDKLKALIILACEISTTNPNLNDLLNRISSYKKLK